MASTIFTKTLLGQRLIPSSFSFTQKTSQIFTPLVTVSVCYLLIGFGLKLWFFTWVSVCFLLLTSKPFCWNVWLIFGYRVLKCSSSFSVIILVEVYAFIVIEKLSFFSTLGSTNIFSIGGLIYIGWLNCVCFHWTRASRCILRLLDCDCV